MRSKLSLGIMVAALAAALSPAPALAADHVYVSGPGEQVRGYTLPVYVIEAGDTMSYLNIDIAQHTVTALDTGEDLPWCELAGYGPGKCPMFDSLPVGLGQNKPVYGIENVPVGSYEFKCIFHPAQVGTLFVI